jgi:hypothetical protein
VKYLPKQIENRTAARIQQNIENVLNTVESSVRPFSTFKASAMTAESNATCSQMTDTKENVTTSIPLRGMARAYFESLRI